MTKLATRVRSLQLSILLLIELDEKMFKEFDTRKYV